MATVETTKPSPEIDLKADAVTRKQLLRRFWRVVRRLLAARRRPPRVDPHRRDPGGDPDPAFLPVPDERLESVAVRRARTEERAGSPVPGDDLRAAAGRQRVLRDHQRLHQDDHAAPVARVVDQLGARPLAGQRPALSPQPGRGRPPESRKPHHRRHPLRDRSAGRHRRRHPRRVPVGGDVHLRAVVGRRRDRFRARRHAILRPGLPRHCRVPLCDVRHRLDADHRPQLRQGLRSPEPA